MASIEPPLNPHKSAQETAKNQRELRPNPALKRSVTVQLCEPRGFCAGVDRAIQIVELALERYGAPVYVRHEIVHNRYVVEALSQKGAIFVDELDEIPDTKQPVIFSAHGVPKAVFAEAEGRNMLAIDATCPLVTKVHRETYAHDKRGRHIILIGHEGHPEVIGTLGQLPEGTISLIQSEEDAHSFQPTGDVELAYVTQTTLSVDETQGIIDILAARFPAMVSPHKEDICYATTNRQTAVKRIAPDVDAMIVVGAPNSSNSQRLRETALRAGARQSQLVQRAENLDWSVLHAADTIGITAGASTPEVLVEEVIDALKNAFDVTIEIVKTTEETTTFSLPRLLRDASAE